MELRGSVAVITGAASGIGAATARAFAAAGARLTLGDLDEDGLRALADDLGREGTDVTWRRTDVRNEADVAALMDEATRRFGAIHVVLPAAGIFDDAFTVRVKDGHVRSVMSTESFRNVVDVNLTGTFLTLREAAARMVEGGGRGVLFTVSSINKAGELGQMNYAASKAAVALWPKILVGELHAQGVHGIRVVGIAPGYVRTPILEAMSDEARTRVLKRVPLGRLIETSEITDLIRHVVHNEAINATTLEVAGGTLSSGLPK